MIAKKEFIIQEHINKLGDPKKGYYKCPNCGEYKLSIHKEGKKYNCFFCGDSKAIAYNLLKTQEQYDRFEVINNSPSFNNEDYHQSKIVKLCHYLQDKFPSLSYNLHKQQIWLDSQPFSEVVTEPELLYIWIAVKDGIDFAKEKVIDTLTTLAMEHAFNPLKQELDDFRLKFIKSHGNNITKALQEAEILLNGIASKYLDTNSSLYNLYARNWLLSAIGRVYLPGCYTRSVLILQGEQNIGKSSFFHVIGGQYFSDSLMEARNKDEVILAHSNWILEYQELENLWGRKTIGRVKAFISSSQDTIRLPYARTAKTLPRSFVFCGTTNEKEFLTDSTGNTRFWIIPTKKINLEQLENDRGHILGGASLIVHYAMALDYHYVETGKLWALPTKALKASEDNNNDFEEIHPFEEKIDELIEIWCTPDDNNSYLIAEKIWESLDIELKERPRFYNQVNKLMRKKGFQNKTTKSNGKTLRIWAKK